MKTIKKNVFKALAAALLLSCMAQGVAYENEDLHMEPFFWEKEPFYYEGLEFERAREMAGIIGTQLVDWTCKFTPIVVYTQWFGAWYPGYRDEMRAPSYEKSQTLQRLRKLSDQASDAVLAFHEKAEFSDSPASRRHVMDLIQAVANVQACAEVLLDRYDAMVVQGGYLSTSKYEVAKAAPSDTINRGLGFSPGYLFQASWYILEGSLAAPRLREHPAMQEVYEAWDALCDELWGFGFLWETSGRRGQLWGGVKQAETSRYCDLDFPLK